jgi:hypothetical protein
VTEAFGIKVDYKEIAVAALVGAGVVWLAKTTIKEVADKVSETLPDIGNAINPVNKENIFNRAVQSVGETLSGDSEWNLFESVLGPYPLPDSQRERDNSWWDTTENQGVAGDIVDTGASGTW